MVYSALIAHCGRGIVFGIAVGNATRSSSAIWRNLARRVNAVQLSGAPSEGIHIGAIRSNASRNHFGGIAGAINGHSSEFGTPAITRELFKLAA